MSVPAIDQLVADVEANLQVGTSAILLINGIKARIDQAVKDALAGGATAAELAPLTTLSASIKAETQALADAVVANTPAA